MPDSTSAAPNDDSESALQKDRRGNPRRSTFAVFTMRFPETAVMGAGKNVSTGGAYFVTSDEVQVELCFEKGGDEKKISARLVRMDRISPGTMGVAVKFENPLADEELP